MGITISHTHCTHFKQQPLLDTSLPSLTSMPQLVIRSWPHPADLPVNTSHYMCHAPTKTSFIGGSIKCVSEPREESVSWDWAAGKRAAWTWWRKRSITKDNQQDGYDQRLQLPHSQTSTDRGAWLRWPLLEYHSSGGSNGSRKIQYLWKSECTGQAHAYLGGTRGGGAISTRVLVWHVRCLLWLLLRH